MKHIWCSQWYFWLCLSKLPLGLARPELDRCKGEMLNQLQSKGCGMNSAQDKTIHPVLLSLLRNCLSRYPKHAYIRDRQLHFDRTP